MDCFIYGKTEAKTGKTWHRSVQSGEGLALQVGKDDLEDTTIIFFRSRSTVFFHVMPPYQMARSILIEGKINLIYFQTLN